MKCTVHSLQDTSNSLSLDPSSSQLKAYISVSQKSKAFWIRWSDYNSDSSCCCCNTDSRKDRADMS